MDAIQGTHSKMRWKHTVGSWRPLNEQVTTATTASKTAGRVVLTKGGDQGKGERSAAGAFKVVAVR